MNALRGVVRNKLGRGIVGMQLDLIDCWHDLGELAREVTWDGENIYLA